MAEPDITDSLATLISEFSKSGLAELSVRSGELELYLSSVAGQSGKRRPFGTSQAEAAPHAPASPAAERAATATPAPVPATPVPAMAPVASPADLPANARIVTAPNLGTFYRAPKPGAAPYIEVGQTIAEGDELCLIEVMKLFTAVRAEFSGQLHAVLTEDGTMVEAGQPLFALVDA